MQLALNLPKIVFFVILLIPISDMHAPLKEIFVALLQIIQDKPTFAHIVFFELLFGRCLIFCSDNLFWVVGINGKPVYTL